MASRSRKPAPEAPAPEVPEVKLPPSVTLTRTDGTLKLSLVVPQSPALRNMVTWAVLKSDVLAPMAALGLCSVTLGKHVRWDRDVLGYGERVLDYLLSQGVPYLAALQAANVAWQLMSADIIKRDEVKADADF